MSKTTYKGRVAATTSSTERVNFLDIAKGILIILVVIGHSNYSYTQYIYWFHMPAFFIISGVLHIQPKDLGDFLRKRIFSLFFKYEAKHVARETAA